jgi:hypothetical protein
MTQPVHTPNLCAAVEGIAFWTPQLPNWETARAAIRGESVETVPVSARPAPTVLAPTERRRAPDTVLLALEVAEQACRRAGRDPNELDSVFASTHGDLAINDYLCSVLATTPDLISPTKFHHSVHNAAAGYWSIGTGSHTAYTAISANDHTFAAGLLEAVTQVGCSDRPVLFIAYDIEARGPLASIVQSRGLFAVAFVLSASQAPHHRAIVLRINESRGALSRAQSPVTAAVANSALASALPFVEALAIPAGQNVTLGLSKYQHLKVEVSGDHAAH